MSEHPVIQAINERAQELEAQDADLAQRMERMTATRERVDAELAALRQAEQVLSAGLPSESVPSDKGAGGSSQTPAPESRTPPRRKPSSTSNGGAPARPAGATRDAIREALRGSEWLSQRDILAKTDCTHGVVRGHLSALVKEGEAEAKGTTKDRRYRLRQTVTPATPPAERKKPGADTDGEGTPEGRVLQYLVLNADVSGPAISLALGIPLNELRPILGKLMREGELRSAHKGGETVYRAVG